MLPQDSTPVDTKDRENRCSACNDCEVDDRPDLIPQFDDRFRIVDHPAMLRAERTVIGAEYGASSYTTVAQADQMAALLDLGPGMLLLDIGSGAGWPGNYLAASTGCRAVLIDPASVGMSLAVERARRDGIDSQAAVATGAALPFRGDTFDAVTSSDAF